MTEKYQYARKNLDHLRRLLILEPRGHNGMYGAVLTEPSDPECDYGLLFCDSGGWLTMCGHGIIGTAVCLLQTGRVEALGGEALLRFDTPGGRVKARVLADGGRWDTAWFENVPSFLYAGDQCLSVPGVGDLAIDVSYGGNFFVTVSGEQVGLEIVPWNGQRLVEVGMVILRAANQAFQVQHPTERHINSIGLVELYQPADGGADYRNITVFGQGNFDRSPCGSGTCARMAELHSRGRLEIGQPFVHESIIGTRFEGVLVGRCKVGEFDAVLPHVKGSAYITGLNTFVLDPEDPLRDGFMVL